MKVMCIDNEVIFIFQDTKSIFHKKTSIWQDMSRYNKLSISHKDKMSLSPNASIVVLVITRWNDIGSRMFVRNTVLDSTIRQLNGKILFVFGISKNASKNERIEIKNEQEKYMDMIIPGKFYHSFFDNYLKTGFCFRCRRQLSYSCLQVSLSLQVDYRCFKI